MKTLLGDMEGRFERYPGALRLPLHERQSEEHADCDSQTRTPVPHGPMIGGTALESSSRAPKAPVHHKRMRSDEHLSPTTRVQRAEKSLSSALKTLPYPVPNRPNPSSV